MKKVFKKLLLTLIALLTVFILAGCNYEENIVVDSNGEAKVELIQWISVDEFKLMMSDFYDEAGAVIASLDEDQLEALLAEEEGYVGKKTGEDGITYFGTYVDDEDSSTMTDFSNNSEFTVTASEFIFSPKDTEATMSESVGADVSAEDIDLISSMVTFTINVTMPDEIAETNGKLSKDGKTATFDVPLTESVKSDMAFYAYTVKSDKLLKASLKYVNEDGFTKSSKVKIVCSEPLTSIKVNGIKQKSKTVSTKKDGTYVIEIATKDATKTFTVIRDTTAPKISGVKSKKTYSKKVTIKFSDADSGIKSATLNGKEIKSGKKVKSNGNYTLVITDKAGNVKTVKFTIKK